MSAADSGPAVIPHLASLVGFRARVPGAELAKPLGGEAFLSPLRASVAVVAA